MGKVATKAYVEAKLAAIPGVKQVLSGRLPDGEYPGTGFPIFIVENGPSLAPSSRTFMAGGDGKALYPYDLNILLMLNRKDTKYTQAQTAALAFYDEVRAAFSNDPTLGGNAWDATLMDSINNLDIFREADVGQYPQVAWKLRVTEERAYSAVAS